MPQLLIEIPAPAGWAIGFALAIYIVARAIRLVWPILSSRAAVRVALIRGSWTAPKRR